MNTGNILLVEDNPDDVDLTLDAFRAHKLANHVVVARDGAEALECLFGSGEEGERAQTALPTVMILDLNLPKIGGLEVLRRVRAHARTKHLPVVILTTSNEQTDVISAYDNGANAFVQKPVAFEEFLTAAGRLGLFWVLTNIRPPQ